MVRGGEAREFMKFGALNSRGTSGFAANPEPARLPALAPRAISSVVFPAGYDASAEDQLRGAADQLSKARLTLFRFRSSWVLEELFPELSQVAIERAKAIGVQLRVSVLRL